MALIVASQLAHGNVWIVRKEQSSRTRNQVIKQRGLLIDQQLREPVVTHRDRSPHPWHTGDQVRTENDRSLVAPDLGEQHARRVAVALMQPVVTPERLALIPHHALQATSRFKQRLQFRNEALAVTCVWRDCALPRVFPDDVARVAKHQFGCGAFAVSSKHTAGVIEVQVRQHHDVDVRRLHADRCQVAQQHVLALLHAVSLAQLRREERANACLEQDRAIAVLDQQATAREVNAVGIINDCPMTPHGLRRVPKHGAAIQLL